MPMSLPRFAQLITLALALSGCQSFSAKPTRGSLTVSPESTVAQQHLRALRQLQQWQAKGKIKITVEAKPHSAAFDWQQYKHNYAINFFGPFGYGSSWLRRTSKGITLESPNKPRLHADNAEALLLQTVGWEVPISNLQYWIKGQPAPKLLLSNESFTKNGAYESFEQQGWTIQLNRHQYYDKRWLPGRLIASRPGLTVLVVIKAWEL